MPITPLRRVALLLATAALLGGSVSSADAARAPDRSQGGATSDAVGDVEVSTDEPLTQADLDSIDLTRVQWSVATGRKVKFGFHVVDLADATSRPFYGLVAYSEVGPVSLAVRGNGVVVIDEMDRPRPCRGSRAALDDERDVVRFSFPVRCLPAVDRFNFKPVTLLESPRAGADLAWDDTPRTGRLSVR